MGARLNEPEKSIRVRVPTKPWLVISMSEDGEATPDGSPYSIRSSSFFSFQYPKAVFYDSRVLSNVGQLLPLVISNQPETTKAFVKVK